MKKIQLTKEASDEKVDTYLRHPAAEEHGEILIDSECAVYAPDGSLLFILKHKRNWDPAQRNVLVDMTVASSTRLSGYESTSSIVGFRPRDPRQNYCGPTRWHADHPEKQKVLDDIAREMAKIYREVAPRRFALHMDKVQRAVKPFWIIHGTPFTSGIVNKNNALHYHYDRGNFKGNFSAMAVFLKGKIEGGFLVLPKYGVRIKFHDGDVIFFDGQALCHGVSPMVAEEGAERITYVLYSLNGMSKCGTPEEEQERLKLRENNKLA